MKLYELINPSDPYTFRAPNIKVAGAAVIMLSTNFGAKCLDDGESTPILFGWDAWAEEHGITSEWMHEHADEIADALDSFLIGSASQRKDIEGLLDELPPKKREKARAQRQDKQRTSMNKIGEYAYKLAKQLRSKQEAVNP